MRRVVLIAHNLRSSHNVGSLLRTAEGLGVEKVYLTGYTPYPASKNDKRLPHLAQKTSKQINKTALGAEKFIKWEHSGIDSAINKLKEDEFTVCALEQAPGSIMLTEFSFPDKIAIVVGREVEGIEPEVLKTCDQVLEIPMFGRKESYNVAQAAAMALFYCRFS